MKVLAVLVLALAISYVQADGAHSHAPAPVHDSGYGPPAHDTGYGPPVHDTYDPPATYEHHNTYDPPVTYDDHHVGYEPEPIFDIIPLIVACLVLVGLGILFPTAVRIDSVGRKKRYAEEVARSDFVGRTIDIYDHLNLTLEPVDRGCMEKITCEVGGLAYDSGVTSHPFLKLVIPFVPGKYGKYMKHFLYAENCHKIKCSAYP